VTRLKGEEMSKPKEGLARLGLDNAIRLRWALRDINSQRIRQWPVAAEDLRTLISMGLVEIVDGQPVITLTGMDEMNIGD
jgi:hypothetical protein